jgi:hypothetical protein
VGSTLHALGVLYLAAGDDLKAKAVFERALAVWGKVAGADSEPVRVTRARLAEIEERAEGRE